MTKIEYKRQLGQVPRDTIERHESATNVSRGQNRQLQLSIGICYILTVVSAFLAWACGMGIDAVGGAFIVSSFFICCCRIALAKRLLQIHAVQWCRVVLVPIVVCILFSSLITILLRSCVISRNWRLILVPALFISTFSVAGWRLVLSRSERSLVWKFFRSKMEIVKWQGAIIWIGWCIRFL